MLINDGILSPQELSTIIPPSERLEKGPVAIIECVQDIPCDPCVYACPRKAITMRTGITDKPHLDYNLCNGCTLCVASCPGLAIFVVNMAYSKDSATVALPYEMLPVPKEGDIVTALDRAGKPICEAKVVKVTESKKYDKTITITIEVPKQHAMNARAIKVSPYGGRK